MTAPPGDAPDRPGPVIVSIDVEDWPQSTWDRSLPISERAARNTDALLDLLAEHEAKVTMFVLGRFAERFPDLVRRMVREGHEVASHGFGHVEVFRQTPAVFRADVARSKQLLEDLTGQPVQGYRAPDFSVMPETLWALDVLADLGFQYDSSIFPIRMKRYGIEDWPTHPVRLGLAAERGIIECPIGTMTGWGRRWPVAGGGYHRLLPGRVIRAAVARSRRSGDPFMAYCHPYEFDPAEFESLDVAVPWRTRLHQGLGRSGFRRKFVALLHVFGSRRACDVLCDAAWPRHALPPIPGVRRQALEANGPYPPAL